MAAWLKPRSRSSWPPKASNSAELIQPWEALTQAGHQPVLISPAAGTVQMFEHLDPAQTRPVDVTVSNASVGDYAALVLPGGVDGNLITSRDPGDLPAFNAALLDALGQGTGVR